MKQIILIAVVVLISSCSNTTLSSPDQALSSLVTSTSPKLLCLAGDSRVAGWPTGYFTDWDVRNIGVGGTTSVYSAYAIFYQTQRFDTLIISVGVNDIATGMTLNDSVSSLSSCLAWGIQRADHVFITSIPGVVYDNFVTIQNSTLISYRAAQINSYLPSLAASYGATYIPLAETIGNGWFLNPLYDDGSGIHYNSAGYDAIAELYESYIGGEE